MLVDSGVMPPTRPIVFILIPLCAARHRVFCHFGLVRRSRRRGRKRTRSASARSATAVALLEHAGPAGVLPTTRPSVPGVAVVEDGGEPGDLTRVREMAAEISNLGPGRLESRIHPQVEAALELGVAVDAFQTGGVEREVVVVVGDDGLEPGAILGQGPGDRVVDSLLRSAVAGARISMTALSTQ